jgi:phosphoserine phosphatase
VRTVFFDLDGTLTTVESPWQHIHHALGLWDEEGQAHLKDWQAGRIDYQAFFDRDVAMWLGRTRAQLQNPLDEIPFHPQAAVLLEELRSRGIPLVIISSGFAHVARRLARTSGTRFGKIYANEMRFGTDDCLTSVALGVSGAPEHPLGKKQLLLAHCARVGIDPAACLAVGDSASDRPLFEAAGLAVALAETGGFGEDVLLPPGELLAVLEYL